MLISTQKTVPYATDAPAGGEGERIATASVRTGFAMTKWG